MMHACMEVVGGCNRADDLQVNILFLKRPCHNKYISDYMLKLLPELDENNMTLTMKSQEDVKM